MEVAASSGVGATEQFREPARRPRKDKEARAASGGGCDGGVRERARSRKGGARERGRLLEHPRPRSSPDPSSRHRRGSAREGARSARRRGPGRAPPPPRRPHGPRAPHWLVPAGLRVPQLPPPRCRRPSPQALAARPLQATPSSPRRHPHRRRGLLDLAGGQGGRGRHGSHRR